MIHREVPEQSFGSGLNVVVVFRPSPLLYSNERALLYLAKVAKRKLVPPLGFLNLLRVVSLVPPRERLPTALLDKGVFFLCGRLGFAPIAVPFDFPRFNQLFCMFQCIPVHFNGRVIPPRLRNGVTTMYVTLLSRLYPLFRSGCRQRVSSSGCYPRWRR